jgi:hypothetical protein
VAGRFHVALFAEWKCKASRHGVVIVQRCWRSPCWVASESNRTNPGSRQALAVASSFCRLLGLGCPKQASAKIATPRRIAIFDRKTHHETLSIPYANRRRLSRRQKCSLWLRHCQRESDRPAAPRKLVVDRCIGRLSPVVYRRGGEKPATSQTSSC